MERTARARSMLPIWVRACLGRRWRCVSAENAEKTRQTSCVRRALGHRQPRDNRVNERGWGKKREASRRPLTA